MLRPDQTHIATIEVNLNLLRIFLKLPEHVKFLAVRQKWEQEKAGKFEILVESPDLKKVPPYDRIPWAQCVLHHEFCREDEITHIDRGELKQP